VDGEKIQHFPSDIELLSRCRPVYQTLPGWVEDITTARGMADLPEAAQKYINFVTSEVGIPVSLVSVGPGRDQIIRR
jgi:adenylosuccinate synthase